MILGTWVTICIKTLLRLLAMTIILIGKSEVSVGLEYWEDVRSGGFNVCSLPLQIPEAFVEIHFLETNRRHQGLTASSLLCGQVWVSLLSLVYGKFKYIFNH